MMTIKRFEEIEAWQKARQLTANIYRATAEGPIARDFGLRDQIRRAAVSSMSNIAEGFERDGNREFVQFLSMAKGSTGEVRSQLYVALDAGFLDQAHFDNLFGSTEETSRLIAGLMRYLRQSELRGRKSNH
jgi:four helix bundle protein